MREAALLSEVFHTEELMICFTPPFGSIGRLRTISDVLKQSTPVAIPETVA